MVAPHFSVGMMQNNVTRPARDDRSARLDFTNERAWFGYHAFLSIVPTDDRIGKPNRIARRDKAAAPLSSARADCASGIKVILDCDRHTVQRALEFVASKRPVGSTCFFDRTVEAKLNHRVQFRIYFFDPRDMRADHFLTGNFTGSDCFSNFGRRPFHWITHNRLRAAPPSSAPWR
jgi:hypothetical protein